MKGPEDVREYGKECGLTEDEAYGFLAWIGNEVWHAREVANFDVLYARVPELVKIYRAELSVKHNL